MYMSVYQLLFSLQGYNKQVREGRVYFGSWSERMQSIIAREAQQWEPEQLVMLHLVRKQRERRADT